MPEVLQGNLVARGLKFAIVASRFNETVTARLIEGALDALLRHGVDDKEIRVVRVPGSFEIPLVARKLALSKKFSAIICLGALVRGETPHFEYLASEVSKGTAQVGMDSGVPVIFGVLTTDTLEQAAERAGGKAGNKGWDAAMAGIEMANLLSRLGSDRG